MEEHSNSEGRKSRRTVALGEISRYNGYSVVENSAEKKRSLQKSTQPPSPPVFAPLFPGIFPHNERNKSPTTSPSPQEGKMDQMTSSAKMYSMCADSVKSVKAPINLEKIRLNDFNEFVIMYRQTNVSLILTLS